MRLDPEDDHDRPCISHACKHAHIHASMPTTACPRLHAETKYQGTPEMASGPTNTQLLFVGASRHSGSNPPPGAVRNDCIMFDYFALVMDRDQIASPIALHCISEGSRSIASPH